MPGKIPSAHSPIVEADLHSFADGQLAPDRRTAMAQYLAAHPQEAARVEVWRRQNAEIVAAFGPIAQESVPVLLSLTRSAADRFSVSPASAPPVPVAQAADAPAHPDAPVPRRISRGAAFVLGLSVAFGLAGLAFLAVGGRLARPGVSAPGDAAKLLGEQAQAAHRAYVGDGGHAVEMAAGKSNALQAWLSQRTGLAITPPDLAAEGFVLVGGRITPLPRGPGAWLLYQGSAGEKLSLLMTSPMPAADLRSLETEGLATVTGSTIHFGFAVTGSGLQQKLLQIARLIGKS